MTASWRAWVEYDRRSRRGDLSSDPALEWVCVARRPSRSAALAAAGRVVGGTGRIAAYTDRAQPGWRAAGRHLPLVLEGPVVEDNDDQVHVGDVHVVRAVLGRWEAGSAHLSVELRTADQPAPGVIRGLLTGNPAVTCCAEDYEPGRIRVGKFLDVVDELERLVGTGPVRVAFTDPVPVISVQQTVTVQLAHPWGGQKAGTQVVVTRSDRSRLARSGYLAIP